MIYEPVIGLEVHLHLKTQSKMFCSCSAEYFGEGPNTHTCPVCLGLPGSLPTLNRAAVEKGLRLALALSCQVPEFTQFHRKNYYYPDLPKNYQISQYDRPLGKGGFLEISGHRIGVTRVHLEEDAGKSLHPSYADYSLVDLNRAGAPLIELVTEPEINSPEEARLFLAHLRSLAQTLQVSDANPEEGKMRADVNVSVHLPGTPFGTKVEVKNLNSFKSVQRALEYEISRQSQILASGGEVEQATMGWDEVAGRTYLMRTKEGESDYRYFPEPDLPPLYISQDWLAEVKAGMPELPRAKEERYLKLGVRAYDAAIIALEPGLANFFDAAIAVFAGEPQKVANWINADIAGYLNERTLSIEQTALTPANLAELVSLVDSGQITGKVAKELLPEVMAGASPGALVEARGLAAMNDTGELSSLVERVIAQNPEVVAKIKSGKTQALNVLLGQVMKESRGRATPELVRELLNQALGVQA